jgi:hypothetical protein
LSDDNSFVKSFSQIDQMRGRALGSVADQRVVPPPPGYLAGFRVSINADTQSVFIGPGILADSGYRVEWTAGVYVEDKHFDAGVILSSSWYYIYLDTDGTLRIDRQVPVIVVGQYALMHPTLRGYRAIGKLFTDTDSSIVFATHFLERLSAHAVVGPKNYADVSDYVCDQVADEVEHNLARRYLVAAFGGGTVESAHGTFKFSGPFVAKSEVKWRGQGKSTIIQHNGTTAYLFSAIGTAGVPLTNVYVGDMAFTQGASANIGVYAEYVTGFKVDLVNIIGNGPVTIHTAVTATIQETHVVGATGHGFITSGVGATVAHYGNSVTLSGGGFQYTAGDGTMVACKVIGNIHASTPSFDIQTDGLNVSVCVASGGTAPGFKITTANRVHLLGCTADTVQNYGFYTSGVVDCFIDGCWAKSGSTDGFFLDDVTNRTTVQSCVSKSNGGYGYNVNTGCTDCRIYDNNADGDTSGAYLDNGTRTVTG